MRALILPGHRKRGFDSLPIRSGMSPGVVLFSWSGEMVEKRLPTVIVLFLFLVAIILFLVAISVAECVVCLLGGDL